jgi:hypothetical protein
MTSKASFHEDFARQEQVRGGSDRSFGLVFTVVFAGFGLWPLRHGITPRWWSIALAATFLIAALTRPAVLRPLNRLWTHLGLLLGRLINPLVTGFLFFFVFTPMGLIMRLFGYDPLRLRRDTGGSSYWIERRPPGPDPGTMPNQF